MNPAILEEDGRRLRRHMQEQQATRRPKLRVFISFDFDNDKELKDALVGQANNSNSPFDFLDWSLKEAAPEKQWRDQAAGAIQRADLILVICGQNTHKANGVKAEVSIAKGQHKYVAYMHGRPNVTCQLPENAHHGAQKFDWSWRNLEELLDRVQRFKTR